MNNLKAIKIFLKKRLTGERYAHTVNVLEFGLKISPERIKNKVALCCLLHDAGKNISVKELRKLGIRINRPRKKNDPVYHCLAGEAIARKCFGVRAKDVLFAIRHHATSAPGMPVCGKVLVISDLAEKGRKFSGVQRLRKLSKRSIKKAYIEALKRKISFVLEEEKFLLPETIRAYNSELKTGG